jgi:uncharacterized protein with GYD domain
MKQEGKAMKMAINHNTIGGSIMPKYLLQCSYTAEGLKGLLKEGGSKRREAVEQAMQKGGSTLEGFYYAFGDTDLFIIIDCPDNVSAAVTSLIANNSGAVTMKTTVLLTPEEMDQATKQATETSGDYRPPGK